MNRLILAVCLTIPPLAGAAQAPAQMDLSEGARSIFKGLRSIITAAAEKMPAEAYSFQPTPEVRTFSAVLGHLAASNFNQCSVLIGSKHPLGATDSAKSGAKDEMVTLVKESFAYCGTYFDSLETTAQLTERFFEPQSKPGAMPSTVGKVAHAVIVQSILTHNGEMYGYLAVYLRLKGVVPPSSEPRKAG